MTQIIQVSEVNQACAHLKYHNTPIIVIYSIKCFTQIKELTP